METLRGKLQAELSLCDFPAVPQQLVYTEALVWVFLLQVFSSRSS